jgi:hypothetical protein
MGDFAAFSVHISNLDSTRNFEAIYHRTTDLGKDGNASLGIDPITQLNDTIIEPQNEETLKFYLQEALKKDNHNFSLTIGIYLWCEDNGYPTDYDRWEELWIKNLSLSISYEKKINKYSSASWEYQGNQINSKGGILNVMDANLQFDAQINDSLIGNISKNSELRVYLNDKLYKETVKLSELEETLANIKEGGFDFTNLASLSKNEPLNVKIELYIADGFDLEKTYVISVDNIELNIDYNLLFFNPSYSEPESTLPIILTGIGIAVIAGLVGYYLYYRMVLRFPKTIRKLRKYRKSLKKSKIPQIEVTSRKKAFSSKLQGVSESKTTQSIKKLSNKAKKKVRRAKGALTVNKKALIAFFMIFLFLIGFLFSPIMAVASRENIPKLNISENQIFSRQMTDTQLVSGAFQENWIKNPGFETADNWVPNTDADEYDVGYSLNNNRGNYIINTTEETTELLSGTPTNTSAPYWYNSTNFRVDAYPTLGFGLNISQGFYASHLWDEHDGSIYNADQRVSVQWERLITLPRSMEDYNITSASLDVKVNATVKREEGYGSDTYGGYGGIDVYGDDEGNGWSITEGDYVKFYVMLANEEKTFNYTVATYLNKSLGRNIGEANDTDSLLDTIFGPENMYDFIFYLNQVLKDNYQNFTLILGMEFNCEDNFTTDLDEFINVLIKTCDFNITYRRVINQFSKVSWEYKGKPLNSGSGLVIVDLTQARLNFDYKANRTIPFDLTSNSELKFLINGIEHTETVKLYNASALFQRASPTGFDVTDLIPYDENINLTIQMVLADEFGANETITVSIDEVSLVIGYNIYTVSFITRTSISPVFSASFIGLAAIAVAFGIYFIYYYKVLRFPKPIRNVRKYRKSLKKDKAPRDISIPRRDFAFKSKFQEKTQV